MKTKRVFLCLMLLVLGASSAWADKYYQPGPYQGDITPRLTLEQAVGKKFMIYNTAINGGEDRTGFLRNNGVQFELDKTKERDLFVYNESFVYTMEAYDDDANGVNDWYAIKSVDTGLYVNAAGKTDILKATDAKLIITSWDKATEGKSDVNMESWKYNVIANGQITSGGHGSTVFVVKNFNGGDRPYWNGTVNAFDTWDNGHPFAFYIANEVTNGDYLQDLHIYSRVDIFSAQQTYGYVQYADQITANPSYTEEGGFGDLIDGEATTYNVTNRENSVAGHYYQIDLRTSVESLYLYMQRRADGMNAPVKYELQACATANGTYTKIGEYTTELASKAFYTSPEIELNGSYQYLRIVARETSTANYTCMGLSELYVLPTTKEVEDVVGYINAVQSSPLYTKATAKVYTALVEEYNRLYSDARLLSGVPIPGNKYRIYADTYDRTNQRYVNREIMAAENDSLGIKAPGTYNGSTDAEKKKFEWYCEQTTDGHLVFRNVADPTKYLAAGGKMVTAPYKWSINTVETNHYGVPLKDLAQQYLAVSNDGKYWQGEVKAAQDQHQSYTYTYTDNKGNDDTKDDETITQTIECGVCTDFLFIPVPLDETEKKVTITASELAQRNSRLLYNGEVYPLPFSRTFKKRDGNWENQPTMQLLCSNLHSYVGVKVNDGETLATTPKITYDEATSTLSFNLEEITNGDVLDIQLQIAQPFEVMAPALDVTKMPSLYLIRNKHQQGLAQQARPNRAADVDIEIGDDGDGGPISSQTGKRYYAKFNQRNADMELIEGTPDWTLTEFEATSLFYFTETEDTEHAEYYSVNIHNATTVMKCADHAAWNTNGNTWFVQPKKITNNYGYNIGRSTLNANNNPGQVWACNHEDGNKISMYKTGSNGQRVEIKANDDGTAWEFIKVDDDTAQKMLKEFIDHVAQELNDTLDAKATQEGIDTTKVKYYRFIVNTMKERAAGYYDGSFSTPGDNATAKLLQFAQNIHMVEHEIQYALYELPELSEDVVGVLSQLDNAEQPHWYYIRNVNGVVDGKDSYASYTDNNAPMALQQYAAGDDKKLANLFYVVGEKNSYAPVMDSDPDNNGLYHDFPGNNLIVDEYLKVHVHNFIAKEVTLVSKNVLLDSLTNYFPGHGQQTVMDGLTLKRDEDWSIELEYDLAGNTSFNAYGSCLLAGSKDPTKDDYTGEFQVYLKDDRSLVIKVNNKYDTYRFWHTQDYYSHIKVVITYSQKTVTLDVYNSLGEKESIPIPNVTLNDVSKLTSALPAEGAKITSLKTYQVEAMTWKTHEEVAGDANKDEWYILPSSNANNVGLAIVLGEPNDTKMGWTNGEGSDTYITTDLGTADNSTWKFVRVTDFDAHMEELLAMYDFKDCVIYDRELAKLLKLIIKNKALIDAAVDGPGEEALFNEVYYAILNYTGRMPEELKAPKPGKFYTIFPASDVEEVEMCVHVDKVADEISTNEVNRTTKIVTYYQGHDEYNSRGVWYFEGTPEADGFLPNNGLKLKNLHTLTSLNELGAQGALLTEGGTLDVTLEKQGATMVAIRANGNNMARGDVAAKSIINASTTRTFATDKATITFNWEELNTHVNGNTGEISKDDINTDVVKTDKGSVAFSTSHSIMARLSEEEQIGYNTICTFANANTSPTIEHTFTLSGLGDSFTFNHIALDIHAFNAARKYQANGDNRLRQWNVKAQVSNGNGEFTDFFTLADIDIAAGVGTAGDVHQKWGLAGNEFTTTTGTLVVKLTITKGSENQGCFFGLSEVALSNVGDLWYIEEIKEPEYIYHKTSTSQHGHGTLKLGFPALIPQGVEAFHARVHGDIRDDRYISMVSYGEPEDANRILPSNTAVMLRNVNGEAEVKQFKFYYSETDTESIADNYIHGSLYYTVIDCSSYDTTDFDGDGNADGDVNIYMLQTSKTDAKLYWIYEEYSYNGEIKPGDAGTDNGGYVICKANRSFMVLPKIQVAETTSFSLRFESGETTDIEDTMDENVNVELVESIYDLQGRKLDEISEPGIYIINGKKVFIK